MLRQILKSAVDFTFPAHCPFCLTSPQLSVASDAAVCDDCRQKIAPTLEHQCQRCGAETGPFAQTTTGCTHCRGKPIRFQSVTCLGMYNDHMRRAILSGKWSWSTSVIEHLAELLLTERLDELISAEPDLIIPIPQGWTSRLFRPFNPAGIIAAVQGCHVFPDSNAAGQGENPQWLYSVAFRAADLFGAGIHEVFLDCFEPYLSSEGT